MKKIWLLTTCLMLLMSTQVFAQQLPDPSFEEWNGATFNNAIQPTYWHYSNVSQLGIANFNFADRQPGRTGEYCMKVQDQDLEVMGIGETSPGYIALGQPWAYVASIGAINKATAGTYGGIEWTYRPDTMVVWIKREGPRTADENYNILFYSWKGTAQGTTYKGKDGSCTNVVNSNPQYTVDEESDIRRSLDGNECSIASGDAQQIAEGWIFEKTNYPNWTKIKIPIYYLNDLAPEKCNVIFSAGNYPNFRANSGLYAGNSLYVDDAEMIYSSKIQKLYIGGREWKGFDPTNTTTPQTYSLGAGITQMPEIYAIRGAGSLKNVKGNTSTFSGRRLSASECVITPGQIDGEPTTITVTAEDGSSTTTYYVNFVSTPSSNAKLADIQVNGSSLEGFNSYVTNYNVALPYGTTEAPVITADPQDATSTLTITQPTSANGRATIVSVAQDGTTLTYTIQFSVAQLSDITLSDILVDGLSLPGYSPTKSNYTLSIAPGASVPVVTPVSAYPDGAQTITILGNTLENGCQIEVRAPGTTQVRTYRITYRVELSQNASLAAIMLDGAPLEGFNEATTTYYVNLPVGTTVLPQITWTLGDAYQSVNLIDGGLNGATRLVVTAAAGNTLTYRINFMVEESDNDQLQALFIDGVQLEEFQPGIYDYTISLPAGTVNLPVVTWTAGDEYQTIQMTTNTALQFMRITVRAGNGNTNVYTLHFEILKSANALLQMIYLDGDSLQGFEPEVSDYVVVLDTLPIPAITVDADPSQSILISSVSNFGTAHITVRPEDGAENIYSIRFRSADEPEMPEFTEDSLPLSTNARLSALYIGGTLLEGFTPDQLTYTDTLPLGTTQTPMVYPVPDEYGQTITVEHGRPGTQVRVHVLAADSVSATDYIINLPIQPSANNMLAELEVDGAAWTFNPEQTYYEVDLPYGTTIAPAITFTKGEESQRIELHVAPLNRPSHVLVEAEDGSVRDYTIRFNVAKSGNPSNLLLNVLLEGEQFIDLTATTDTVFHINLPYGTDTVGIVSYTKSYPEQRVVIEQGLFGTRLMSYADADNTPAKVYTFVPHTAASPLRLSGITINEQPLEGFDPETDAYLLHIDTIPTIAYTLESPDQATATVTLDTKHWQCTVQQEDFSRLYTVWFFYPEDTIPNPDFSRIDTTAYNSVPKPESWNVPADFAESFTYSRYTYTWGNEATMHGDTVLLKTARNSNPLGGCFPGMMTLGQMTITPARNNGTHSSISGGIPFRNTPDSLIMGYRPISGTSGNHVHVGVDFRNTQNQSNTFDFTDASYNNRWKTMGLSLMSDNPIIAPSEMNITINSALAEDASELKKTFIIIPIYYESQMDVDYVRLAYESKLASIAVNGVPVQAFDTISVDTVPTYRVNVDSVPSFRVDIDSIYNHIVELDTIYRHEITYDTIQTDSIVSDTLVIDHFVTTLDTLIFDHANLDTVRFNIPVYDTIYYDRYDTTHYTIPYRYVVTTPADAYGQPDLQIRGLVPDQIHTVRWEDNGDNRYTAHIRSMAEDSTYTDYMVQTIRPISANTNVQYRFAAGDQLFLTPASPYQTINVQPTDTAFLIHVTAENGDTLTHVAYLPSFMAIDSVLVQEPQHTITGTSDATLTNILVDGRPIADFSPALHNYTLQEDGVLSHQLSYVLDSLTLTVTDSLYTFTVTGADTTLLYLVHRQMASENGLADLQINGVTLDAFDPSVLHYEWLGEELISVSATTIDPLATYTVVINDLDTIGLYKAIYVNVKAQDGTTQVYDIYASVHPLGSSALLEAIFLNGDTIPQFEQDTLTYNVNLPAGSILPNLSAIAAENASLNTLIEVIDDLHTDVIFEVVSEDKADSARYIVHVNVDPFDISHLQMIYVANEPLADFTTESSSYFISLPSGTTTLPAISYDLAEKHQTVAIDTVGFLSSKAPMTVTLTATAQDMIHTTAYAITFQVEKSDNALLQTITLNGNSMDNFDSETFSYTINLPYGTAALPTVDYTLANDSAAAVLTTSALDSVTIQVTAEDMLHVNTYTIYFNILRSSNTKLQMIYVDEQPLETFDANTYEYELVLPYAAPVPTVTWLESDEQQVITGAYDPTAATFAIHVISGDGNIEDYALQFKWLLSPYNNLTDLRVNGTTIDGFHTDSLEYTITYPVGTNPADLLHPSNITYTAQDEEATVAIEEQDDHTITLIVTAPNGDIRVYVIHQVILLDEEARLMMIYLDNQPFRDFHPDTLNYVYELVPGATVPEVTAEALSQYGDVEYGALTDEGEDKLIEIDGIAENGTRITYTVRFTYAKWTSTPEVTEGENLVMHIPGTMTYKAVTLGLNVTVSIYDGNGHRIAFGGVPAADPNDVVVEIDEDGHQNIVEAYDTADGFEFEVPHTNEVYFYVFFDVRNKRVAKGGKFMVTM